MITAELPRGTEETALVTTPEKFSEIGQLAPYCDNDNANEVSLDESSTREAFKVGRQGPGMQFAALARLDEAEFPNKVDANPR